MPTIVQHAKGEKFGPYPSHDFLKVSLERLEILIALKDRLLTVRMVQNVVIQYSIR